MNGKIVPELRSLMILIKREIHSNILAAGGFTGMHCMVAGFLSHQPGRDIFQKDIEQAFSMRSATASKMLLLMEKNGLIFREAAEQDARLKKIMLTEKGHALHGAMSPALERLERNIRKGIPESELELFFKVVDQMKRNLNFESETESNLI